jgi:hypothetical protein
MTEMAILTLTQIWAHSSLGGKRQVARFYFDRVTAFFIVLPVLLFSSSRASTPVELDLKQTNQVTVEAVNDSYAIKTTGGDPWVMSRPLGRYDAENEYMLSFEYFCARGLNAIQLFYGPPIRASHSAEGPAVPSSEGWTTYTFNIKEQQKSGSWKGGYTRLRLDFGNQSERRIQLRNIQLRKPTPHELKKMQQRESVRKERAAFERKLHGMLAKQFPVRIEQVKATAGKIEVHTSGTLAGGLFLCEVPLYQTSVDRTDFVWQHAFKPNAKVTILPRFRPEGDAVHDRIYSGWIVMRRTEAGLEPASHLHFTDTIPPQWQLKRDRPLSKKGTTGLHGGNTFQVNDYKELGVHNCTKNIVLNRLISLKSGKDTFPRTFNKRTYHIRKPALRRLDQAMLEMDKLEIVVSAIILIAKNTTMTHPDCTPQGIWAMPNMATREGWNYYAAGLDFLAERYSRPDRKYGRVTHWIMHNEVDAGWIWTNAGEKPLHTYFDLYYRSMRTAQCTARKYGVAGHVLISLTHHWTQAQNHRCYRPKDIVDLLQKRSALEGDFDWGLAYHSYPQNLRDPRTWLDTKATFSFQTPLITPKNLEVLDAYMRQRQMLYAGEPRTIVLSEQGSNSQDHSDQSYRDQAAGLVYTWLKFEKLDTIESYIHHRWMDAGPGQEGGLLLGFWTNLPNQNPRHRKKPAWDVYRRLGTDQQQEAVEVAKELIHPSYFEAIPFRGKIK